ncbi:phosphoserine phosphatase SerB [Sphingomonas lacunae]|uniref:Phosphoserine phosphatase n=1 Tax=Sphingomonas lacunae TaxID=2698828 RepID=A0A6M4AYR5_9SPHN|nr:phosphoserine phosphatase SerB [Sphingomonas lacunae]QJQ33189.1 phosphoserine phosphatase SerB [Sphingomonas lacunae]
MTLIATLVAPHGIAVGDISAACDAVGGTAGPVVDGFAVDIACSGDVGAVRAALEQLAAWDVFVQPATARGRKTLLIADMDSTMITVECIDELADYAGIKPQIAAITERAMQGELDFRSALAERVALLEGLSEEVIALCLAERVRPMPGARELIRTMKAHGTRCVLVSGGFTRFAEPVGELIGFDKAIANVLEIKDGNMTGKVIEPVVDSGTKLATLHAECAALRITPSDVLAIGDGANDVPMIEAAGLGVAYHGHAAAVRAADAAVRHGNLTSLLWAQGIPMEQWSV